MTGDTKPKSALEMILNWSARRPAWQRDAIRRIVAKGNLDDDDLLELLALCKKGRGAPGIELEAVPLAKEHLPGTNIAGGSILLVSISDVKGVNRLVPGQVLPFAPKGLTVIYGDNGTGKSGYSRILKRACRARLREPIHPNAFETAAPVKASATISWTTPAGAPSPIAWLDEENPHPLLSTVSVFDRDCGRHHIAEKGEIFFRPFGLDIPDELAKACEALKTLLREEQKQVELARDAFFLKPPFSPSSSVGRVLANLQTDTDIGPQKAIGALSEEQKERLRRLNADLGRDPAKVAAERRIVANVLKRLADDVEKLLAATGDGPLHQLMAAAADARDKRLAARMAAEKAFGGTAVKGVGEGAWRTLWEAARRYSEDVAYPAQAFPTTLEALCLLCHQPLGEAAGQRLTAFEVFIQADTEREAVDAEKVFTPLHKSLSTLTIRLSAFVTRHQLAAEDEALGRSLSRSLAAARLRRALILRAIQEGRSIALPAASQDPVPGIRAVVAGILKYADEIEASSDPDERKRLEAERDDLRDRSQLQNWLPKAEEEITRLKSAALLAECLTEMPTNTITALGNSIADEVVTPQVQRRFRSEINKLAASRVSVEIVRIGGRNGSPQYQVRFAGGNTKASVAKVLSEGEQTCVALAAFLTELETAAHGSALVFDDPVTSLDHRWRQKVAERLVEEARRRQVVVFTHDLVFLNDLHDLSGRLQIDFSTVSLSRSPSGAGVVNSGLPWAGARLKERLDQLEKDARSARVRYEADDDAGYQEAISSIYSRLRSAWERALEDVAFHNVLVRHRDYINTKELMKVTALTSQDVNEWRRGFKKCCDQTDAHDPSRARNAAPPPPDELLQDVQELTRWMGELKERQKAIP